MHLTKWPVNVEQEDEDNLMGNLQTYCMRAVFQSFTHQAASSRSAINLKYNLRASH